MQQSQIAIVSFYSFVKIVDPEMLIPKILYVGKRKLLRGTILVAREGFNGSISGPEDDVQLLLQAIIDLTKATDVNVKTNYSGVHPFHKLKVKLKPEIISMGIKDFEVAGATGDYIEPKDWDEFIARDDVILVDTRNDYEVAAGTFENAIDPRTETFKQFPKWAQDNLNLFQGKKVAMCCTGGVRCEKSTAYMRSLGFQEVYHLKGGILQYLEDTGNKAGKWHGECFVFDDRRGVDDNLEPV
jgi:UPF0176 protein